MSYKIGKVLLYIFSCRAPLEIIGLHIKAEYGTLNKAKHYRDGMLITSVRVKVEVSLWKCLLFHS